MTAKEIQITLRDNKNGFSPKKTSFFVKLLRLLVVGVLIAIGIILYDAYTFLYTPAEEVGREIIFTIEPGSTFDHVARDLKKAGAITDVSRFRMLAKYDKAIGLIKSGDFLIDTNWTPAKVLYQITKGPVHLVRLSFREGLTWWQTAKEIEKQGFASYENFVAVIHDPNFLKSHAIPFDNAEGFLFPDTYFLTKPKNLGREQAESVASLLVKTFWKKNIAIWKRLPIRKESAPEGYGNLVADIGTNLETLPPLSLMPAEEESNATTATPTYSSLNAFDDAVYAQDPALQEEFVSPLSPAEVSPNALKKLVTLASLVERETSVGYERPRVAGVYANRLRLNMLLQCDPTIIYGIGPSFSGVLKRSQIKDASNPYNTYKNPGLPPSPISSMGVPALTAALMPEIHNYLYFVATGRGKGHSFSKKLEDHNKAVRIYRQRVNH